MAAVVIHEDITFGFDTLHQESEKLVKAGEGEPRKAKPYRVEPNVGLGRGPGGEISRSFLAANAQAMMDRNSARRRGPQRTITAPVLDSPRPKDTSDFSLRKGTEPQGMFMALLLNDTSPPNDQDVAIVRRHRWTFYGAEKFALQSTSYCFFIWCLLDLQRNVQLDEDGDALDQRLAGACKTWVGAQCREGNMAGMYQLLTHFISNSLVFLEWERFLRIAFDDERASQESFLVPHLQQVWTRFTRFQAVLKEIFNVLDSRFVWRHRLPEVGDFIHEHMRKRCFSAHIVHQNELICQASSRNEIIKQVKYALGIQ